MLSNHEALGAAIDPNDCPKLEAVNIAIEAVHQAKTDAEMFDPLCRLFDAGAVSRREVVRRIENLKSVAKIEDDPYGCTPTWNAALDKAIEAIEAQNNDGK